MLDRESILVRILGFACGVRGDLLKEELVLLTICNMGATTVIPYPVVVSLPSAGYCRKMVNDMKATVYIGFVCWCEHDLYR